jgi:hypothetical protein
LVLRGHAQLTTKVAFSQDGRWLFSGSGDRTVRQWSLSGGSPRVFTWFSDQVWGVALSPDGRRVAASCNNGEITVWDMKSGIRSYLRGLQGHVSEVRAIAFSPDGQRLVDGSFDKTVRIWDVKAGGSPLVLQGHKDRVNNVAFSHDGRRIASGSADNTIRVWEINCQHLWRLRQATDAERNKAWFAACFHLHWLMHEERAKQCFEMFSGLTSASPLGAAANLVALNDREGRVPLPELQNRHFRATMQLAGWFWH